MEPQLHSTMRFTAAMKFMITPLLTLIMKELMSWWMSLEKSIDSINTRASRFFNAALPLQLMIMASPLAMQPIISVRDLELQCKENHHNIHEVHDDTTISDINTEGYGLR